MEFVCATTECCCESSSWFLNNVPEACRRNVSVVTKEIPVGAFGRSCEEEGVRKLLGLAQLWTPGHLEKFMCEVILLPFGCFRV